MTEHATEQVALFMNARDNRNCGTAIWSRLDIVGREAYLTDAAALVAAVKALGWAPVLTPTDDEREAVRLRAALEDVWSTIQRDVRVLANLDPGELGGIVARALEPSRSEVPEPSAGEDEFTLGECDGSGKCPAEMHVHGCYMPHRADQCDSPDEYGHLPAEPQGEPSDAQVLDRIERFAQSDGVMFAGGPRGAWLPADALLDILGERAR